MIKKNVEHVILQVRIIYEMINPTTKMFILSHTYTCMYFTVVELRSSTLFIYLVIIVLEKYGALEICSFF